MFGERGRRRLNESILLLPKYPPCSILSEAFFARFVMLGDISPRVFVPDAKCDESTLNEPEGRRLSALWEWALMAVESDNVASIVLCVACTRCVLGESTAERGLVCSFCLLLMVNGS